MDFLIYFLASNLRSNLTLEVSLLIPANCSPIYQAREKQMEQYKFSEIFTLNSLHKHVANNVYIQHTFLCQKIKKMCFQTDTICFALENMNI